MYIILNNNVTDWTAFEYTLDPWLIDDVNVVLHGW